MSHLQAMIRTIFVYNVTVPIPRSQRELCLQFIATCFGSHESCSGYDYNDICLQSHCAYFEIPEGIMFTVYSDMFRLA